MIWGIFAAMTVVALGFVLAPLLRARMAGARRAEYDMMVYRDQLAEIARDVERGLLKDDQAEAARAEVARRMLSADGAAKAETAALPAQAAPLVAVLVALALPLGAFGLYALLGAPALPGQPFATRTDPMKDMGNQMAQIETMVEGLAARLAANPGDGKGWSMLARSYRVLGRRDEALAAYEQAVRLLPQDIETRMAYAGLLLQDVPRGELLPEIFLRQMRAVLALDPTIPDALYFVGLGEMQAGNRAKAKALWSKLLSILPEGSEDRAELAKQLQMLE